MWQKIKSFYKKVLKFACICVALLFWSLFIGITYCFVEHIYNGAYKEAVYTGVAVMLMLNVFLGE